MFVQLTESFWNLEVLNSYRKNERTGEYLLMFPIGGGNVKLKRDHPAYPLVDAYLTEKTRRLAGE